jgi:hypothetical protein
MGAGTRVVCSGAALRRAGQAPQGGEADASRLAPGGPRHGAAAKRLGLGHRALAPRLRRSSAYYRPGRAISLPILWQGVVPRLPPNGLPALRACDHVIFEDQTDRLGRSIRSLHRRTRLVSSGSGLAAGQGTGNPVRSGNGNPVRDGDGVNGLDAHSHALHGMRPFHPVQVGQIEEAPCAASFSGGLSLCDPAQAASERVGVWQADSLVIGKDNVHTAT